MPVLDGLRGLSIGLVLLSHLIIYNNELRPWMREVGLASGSAGVTVFFVISGFLITSLLIKEEDATGNIGLRRFYVRRVLRIFPAYYVYLSALAVLVMTGIVNLPRHDFLASVLYIRNLVGRGHESSHLWSLSLEEQFYFLWPSLLVLVSLRRRIPMVMTLIIGITLWRSVLVLTSNVGAGALYIRTDMRFDSILIGCALALMLRTDRFKSLASSLFARGWVFCSILIVLVAWILYARLVPYSATIETGVTALLIAVLVNYLLESTTSIPVKVLSLPPLLLVGRLSYSLYLWQQLFLGSYTPELGFVRKFPVNIILTFLAAGLSYYLIERPFLRLKSRYAKHENTFALGVPTAQSLSEVRA